MSKLDDLKAYIGRTVYFTEPMDSPGLTRSNTLDSATLVSVSGAVSTVRWTACLCLDWHKPGSACAFEFTENVSTFRLQTVPQLMPAGA